MRIVFAGTPDFAAAHLKALIKNKFNVVAVYTQPDRPKGRGHSLAFSPVKEVALENDIPVYQPLNFKSEDDVNQLRALNADIIVVVAYGIILPKSVLEAAQKGCINVHGSILPRWRGAAPIQRSLLEGDKTTGVTIIKINEKLDAGDMLAISETEITNSDTSSSLYLKLEQLGCSTLINSLNNIDDYLTNAVKQDESQVTYAAKLNKEEAEISFEETAEVIHRKIRGYNPWPMAYFVYKDLTIKIHEAEVIDNSSTFEETGVIHNISKNGLDITTAKGVIRLTKIQFPNKKPMSFSDILNGNKELFKTGGKLL